ncbi:hypothetical protein [Streptomyces sp. SID3343]|uniref:hypothetical protein n=1 Tax=Streptomyces sp. SID3343 TaxID=2690260 RepID=UPI00136E41EF|nr:hypothetical protein [Streptomyces sp. SID3343]MYW02928.1 hypothetical protein [Streptomyces sp. SID3343]
MAITETERVVPDRAIDPPFALVYDVVRRAAREREAGRAEMRKRLDAGHERYTGLAADAAVALHELRGCLDGEPVPTVLASIARRFATALDRAGVRFDDPVGEAYAAVGRRVDVAHAPDEGDEGRMIVAKTLRPGVLLDDGEVIRRAQVVLGFVPTPAQREGAAHARVAADARVEAADAVAEHVEPVEARESAEAAEPVEAGEPIEPELPASPSRPQTRKGKGRKPPRGPKTAPEPAPEPASESASEPASEPVADPDRKPNPTPEANGTRPAGDPTQTPRRTGEERTDNEGGTTG